MGVVRLSDSVIQSVKSPPDAKPDRIAAPSSQKKAALKISEPTKEEKELKQQELLKKSNRQKIPAFELVKKRKVEAFKNASKAELKVTKSEKYLKGNFRGVLQDYINSLPEENHVLLAFSSRLHDDGVSFLSKCNPFTLWGATYSGKGVDIEKKTSIHLAALDVMLMMNLLTSEEH